LSDSETINVSEAQRTLTLEGPTTTLNIHEKRTFTAKLQPEVPDGSRVEYCFQWNDGLGDDCGAVSTREHEFGSEGTYPVSVSVAVNKSARLFSEPLQVQVLEPKAVVQTPTPTQKPPTVSLTADTAFPALGRQTGFRILVDGKLPSNGPIQYCFAWDKGTQEACQDSPQATHAFTAAGTYSVSAIVKQDRDRFAAKPVLIRVYQVGLTSVLSEAKADKPVHFEAKLSSDLLAKRLKYCFHWGDNTQTCGPAAQADHAFTSGGRYSNFVEVFMNDVKIATSNSVVVTIGWPLWLTILVWAGGVAAVSAAAYGVRKARPPRTAPEAWVRVTPHYDGNPQYKVTGPKSPPRCLVRIQWVRSSASATINLSGNLIKKKKGSAHA